MQPLPKYVASIVTRFIKPLCGAYSDLVSAYSTHSSEKLREVLSKHHEVYVKVSSFSFLIYKNISFNQSPRLSD